MTVNGRCDFDVDNIWPNDILPIIFHALSREKRQEQKQAGTKTDREEDG